MTKFLNKKINIKKFSFAFIWILLINQISYAGMFFFDNGKIKYLDDQGKIAVGWRWIDTNNDNIAECYRFEADGTLATTSRVKGKDVNKDGKWVVNGVVQQINKTTWKPLYEINAGLSNMKSEGNEIKLGTESATKRINATKKDIKSLMEADLRKDDEAYRKSLVGPKGEYKQSEKGYEAQKGVKLNKKVPVATKSNEGIIFGDNFYEEAVRYVSATQSIVAGRDARKFVLESSKYTESVNNAKIYGGEIWDDAICLSGNGASVKFTLVDMKSSFRANYCTFEIAHQTHGESTADTYCGIEYYINGKSIDVFDEFVDGEPEKAEIYFDDGESNLTLKAIVTGDAPGRKIYIRNLRFRQLREKKDE